MGLLENFLLFFPKFDSRVSQGFKLLLLNSYLKHFIKESTWIFIGSNNGEVPILWPPDVKRKRPWCWERSKAKEQGSRGWDGWIASLTQWTWVWANCRREWRRLVCYSLWGCKELDVTERLDNNNLPTRNVVRINSAVPGTQWEYPVTYYPCHAGVLNLSIHGLRFDTLGNS